MRSNLTAGSCSAGTHWDMHWTVTGVLQELNSAEGPHLPRRRSMHIMSISG